MIESQTLTAASERRPQTIEWTQPSRQAAIGLAVAVIAWVLVVAFAEPFGRLWGTGQDARSYWLPILANPYLKADWTNPLAYVYSPAFLQLVTPLALLPWQIFVAVWTAILLAAVRFLTGPRLLALGVLAASMELAGGNISLLLAVAIVLGFRWPATWAFVLLTKVTPGIGLLWFVVRGEWRQLAIAVGATLAVITVSALFLPAAWADWIAVLTRVSGREGTWAAIPIPFLARLPMAVAVVLWGARTNRRWTVPVASMIALPALWYGGLSMMLAVLPLLASRDGSGQSPAGSDAGRTARSSRGGAEPAPAGA